MKDELLKILESTNANHIDAETAQVQVLDLFNIRLSLPDEKELNALRSQYRASGGDAGWIQDAYKKGFIDGWNKKRTDSHLRKPTYKSKPKPNEA